MATTAIQLVFEPPTPSPPPAAPPAATATPAPPPATTGIRVSDESGDPAGDRVLADALRATGDAARSPGEAPPPPSLAQPVRRSAAVARPKDQPDADPSAVPPQDAVPTTPEETPARGVLSAPATPTAERHPLAAAQTHHPDPAAAAVEPGGPAKQRDPGLPAKAARLAPSRSGEQSSGDPYLSQLSRMIRQRVDTLPPALFAGLDGEMSISLRIRRNGSIVWSSVGRSSDRASLDRRVLASVQAIGQFPPIPPKIDGETLGLTIMVPLGRSDVAATR